MSPSLNLDDLLQQAEVAHGHLCAGQVLGVRMAMLACNRLGIEDPRGKDRKRLVTFIEIDRCATDAIGVVTGCRLGKRALKLRDWGKMAATFADLNLPLEQDLFKALRISARESSRQIAADLFPHLEKNQQQMHAYREMPDDLLFSEQWVQVSLPRSEFPGFKGARIACTVCGEGISYDRFVEKTSGPVCLGCAEPAERYYQPLS